MSSNTTSPGELSPQEKRALLEKLLKEKAAQSNKGTQKESSPERSLIPLVDRARKYFPLSSAQQRLWLLDRLDPGNPVYNISIIVRLKGELHIGALEQSLASVMGRHEILSANFAEMEGEPVQFLVTGKQLSLSQTDLTDRPISARQREAEELAEREAQRSFDLAQDVLARANLYRLDENDYLFQFVIHHIVFDGWSLNIFLQELTYFYTAFDRKETPALPPLPVQYIDFASWEAEQLDRALADEHVQYWKKQLAGHLPALEMPLDRPRPEVQSFRSGREQLEISPALTRSLNAISRQEGITLFVSMLSVFYTLLARYTGQEDIIVGTPVTRRGRTGLEQLIGIFINNLALRIDLSGELTFRQLLQRVRRTVLDAFAHQEIPFERLLNELRIERDSSRTPVFQVFFNLLDIRKGSNLELPNLTVETPPPPEVGSLFDLTLYVQNWGDMLKLKLVYNADLFSPEHMAELLRQYHQLLEAVVASPDQGVQSYSLVTPRAAQVLPDPRQSLQAAWYGSVHGRFTQRAHEVPNHLALVDEAGYWTYEELEKRSNQLAHYLLEHGVQRQNVVAIYASRSASLVWAALGILKAGAIFVILDPAYPAARLADYISLTEPRGLINLSPDGELPAEIESRLHGLDGQAVVRLSWDGKSVDGWHASSDQNPGLDTNPDDLAYVAFTSGSTGQPKGILGTHGPLSHFFEWHTHTFHFQETDRFSMLSGLAHDPLLRDIFTPLWVGATLYIPDQEQMLTPGQLLSWMRDQCISVIHLTPAIEQLLTDPSRPEKHPPLANLRYAFFGGEILTRRHILKLKRLAPGVQCVNFYGATETPQAMAYTVIDDSSYTVDSTGAAPMKETVPLGQGIEGVQLLVMSAAGNLAGIGELGEIQIRTPYLSQGYLKDPLLTQEKFVANSYTGKTDDRIYKTGDLGRYLADGRVDYLGRRDGQVKIRGFRIELAEIEAMLNEHPAVRQSVVSAFELDGGDRRLAAYIVPEAAATPEVNEIRDFVQTRLPSYMIPARFILLESIPVTPNGKVDRRALPLPDFENVTQTAKVVPPRNATEEKLVKIWEELLHVQPIGIRDNFFELGGHSLMAVHMFSRIEQEFGINLPLAILFREATIEYLSQVIQAKSGPSTWSSLIEIEPQGNHPPFFCVHGLTGDILWFRDLARCLAPDYPFYGLQSRGLDGIQPPLDSIQGMAAHYIEEIRLLQPEGPYYLGGASFGGTVALEMAQQLLARGEEVALLAIFDHSPPNLPQDADLGGLKRRLLVASRILQNFPRWFKEFVQMGPERMLQRARRKMRVIRKAKGNGNSGQLGRFDAEDLIDFASELSTHRQQLITLNYQALKKYVPQPYAGRVTLFRALNRPLLNIYDPETGWQKLAPGRVCIYDIPSSHEGMFKKPHVDLLASRLKMGWLENR